MDSISLIYLVIIIALIALSAFFSSAETAMMSASPMRIRNLAEEGDKRALTFERILDKKPKMLSAILICNNIVNIAASSLTTILMQHLFGNVAITIGTAVLTVIVLIFGEITPKTVAALKSEKMALSMCRFINAVMVVLTPIIFIINLLTKAVFALIGINPEEQPETITESELKTIVDVSNEEGVTTDQEKDIIHNVFDFSDAMAKDVMVPRVGVHCIDINAAYTDVLAVFKEERYTRFPVYDESPDNIIGILNMKDVILYNQQEAFNVRSFIRPATFTYEHRKISELLIEMKKNAVSIMVVLDEYGISSGIITMEDILEEIVGEIRDEFDEEEYEELEKLNDGEYLVEGQMKLDDLNDLLGSELSSEEYDSVGGFLIEVLDRVPKTGDCVYLQDMSFVIESMDKNRIEKVKVSLKQKENVN